ncbi:MAG: ParB/RepB/Spo0J family partition protein [Oscillospiraceae bacterium]|nr:ParB/RepB/Spo0J family partition protein [Oscillospiraceae bacterium]MBR6561472.1 ParB/RepB/Spo0J family partition protein [Oscillospiraceae bacterium]
MAEKGLGKGFDAIFGKEEEEISEIMTLPITKVEPRQDQPRQRFDEAALQELADSITEYGLIQPITVRKQDNGFYQIIAGERRWRAARLAGLREVPVRILEADDARAMELALVENLQREDLNPIEEAAGYRTLMEDYGLTQEEAARRVGKSRSAVANAMRLLGLCPEVRKLVEEGTLSAGHARAILALPLAQEQQSVANRVLALGLSVRQTETLVARIVKERKLAISEPATQPLQVDYVAELENRLTASLGRRVRLHAGRKKGRLELEYYDNADLEQLIHALELFSRSRGGSQTEK